MSQFTRYYDLFVPIAGGPKAQLLASENDNTPTGAINWVAKDKFTIRVHLDARSSSGSPYTGLQIPSGDQLILSGRPANNLSQASLLFSATDFTEESLDGSYWYEAVLDLSPQVILDTIGTQPLLVLVTLQEQDAANDSRFSFQFQATINPPGYQGDEGVPPAGDPPYPSSASVAALIGAMVFQSTWDASANDPTIPAASMGNKGWFYRVATAGTTSVGGITTWSVKDILWSDGTQWNRLPYSTGGGSSVFLFAKPADTMRSGGSFTIDPDLLVAIAADQKISGRIITGTNGSSAGHLGLLAPSGCKVAYHMIFGAADSSDKFMFSGVNVDGSALAANAADLTAVTDSMVIVIAFEATNGSTAGNIGLAWDGAGGTIVVPEGSTLSYTYPS